MNRTTSTAGLFLVAVPFFYMLLFFILPSGFLFIYSFWKSNGFTIDPDISLANYAKSLTSPLFWKVTWNSLLIGLVTASACLVIAVPFSYYVVYVSKSNLILYVVVTTWFSGYLVRIYAWRSLLGTNGLLNSILLQLGIIDQPLEVFLFTRFAVALALTHLYLPICILMVVSALSEVKRELIDASRDLGTSLLGAFFRIVAPNAAKGLLGAFMITFILVAGDYVTPQMLGGSSGQTTGMLIADQFRKLGNWPMGAAQSFVMFALTGIVYLVVLVISRSSGLLPRKRKAHAVERPTA